MPSPSGPALPTFARSSLNRCNLPAVILGGLTFQQNPSPLYIDGALEIHQQLFSSLTNIQDARTRAMYFRDYMSSCFLLDNKDEAGLTAGQRIDRGKADYLRLLRGWMFNADGIEAAVLKRWVESRFGLLAQNHKGPLLDSGSANYQAFVADYMRGLYNTNALEFQLDVLFSFCQYELTRRTPTRSHYTLYRGINSIDDHHVVERMNSSQWRLLLNNLNSFSNDRTQSDTFGDVIITAEIPYSKILFFPDLLPGILQGEFEFIVIGGVYHVEISV